MIREEEIAQELFTFAACILRNIAVSEGTEAYTSSKWFTLTEIIWDCFPEAIEELMVSSGVRASE